MSFSVVLLCDESNNLCRKYLHNPLMRTMISLCNAYYHHWVKQENIVLIKYMSVYVVFICYINIQN